MARKPTKKGIRVRRAMLWHADKQATRFSRSTLFDALAGGQLDPVKAEQIAADKGFEPLNPPLDPIQYDPERKPYWTLPMAIAWISWRDIEMVREASPDWRRDKQGWIFRHLRLPARDGQTRDVKGWYLEHEFRKMAALLFMQLSEAVEIAENVQPDRKQLASIDEAQSELWEALTEGDLKAATQFDGRPHTIDCVEWTWLEIGEHDDKDVLFARESGVLLLRYGNPVLLPRKQLIDRWPAEGTMPVSPAKSRAAIILAAAEALGVTPAWRADVRNQRIRKWIEENHPELRPTPAKTKIGEALQHSKYVASRKSKRRSP